MGKQRSLPIMARWIASNLTLPRKFKKGVFLVIEYRCPECKISELSPDIEPNKECQECKQIMEADEWEG